MVTITKDAQEYSNQEQTKQSGNEHRISVVIRETQECPQCVVLLRKALGLWFSLSLMVLSLMQLRFIVAEDCLSLISKVINF